MAPGTRFRCIIYFDFDLHHLLALLLQGHCAPGHQLPAPLSARRLPGCQPVYQPGYHKLSSFPTSSKTSAAGLWKRKRLDSGDEQGPGGSRNLHQNRNLATPGAIP
jgi:hypothetical protein